MDHVVNTIATMAEGQVCAVVNCYQFSYGEERCIVGSRVVRASSDSISGMTQDNIHFTSCDVCHAVVAYLGIGGDITKEPLYLEPMDARAKLLCQITDLPINDCWGRTMDGPARIVGMINVHSARKISEVGTRCFHCNAGP